VTGTGPGQEVNLRKGGKKQKLSVNICETQQQYMDFFSLQCWFQREDDRLLLLSKVLQLK